jgi:hypothetical protein
MITRRNVMRHLILRQRVELCVGDFRQRDVRQRRLVILVGRRLDPLCRTVILSKPVLVLELVHLKQTSNINGAVRIKHLY